MLEASQPAYQELSRHRRKRIIWPRSIEHLQIALCQLPPESILPQLSNAQDSVASGTRASGKCSNYSGVTAQTRATGCPFKPSNFMRVETRCGIPLAALQEEPIAIDLELCLSWRPFDRLPRVARDRLMTETTKGISRSSQDFSTPFARSHATFFSWINLERQNKNQSFGGFFFRGPPSEFHVQWSLCRCHPSQSSK